MMEIWRRVPEDPRYQVSDLGRVRGPRGSILRPAPLDGGHLAICLGRGRTRTVHRLVLSAFVGPCPPGHEARHRNGVEACNELSNLSWATKSVNVKDRKLHGQVNRYHKLTLGEILDIKLLLGSQTQRSIAQMFHVDESLISQIKRGKVHV